MKKAETRSLATFRAAHDPSIILPSKIKAAIESMRKEGGDEYYEYEAEFLKRAGVSAGHLATYRDEFAAHIVEARQPYGQRRDPKRVWFATVKAAKAARGE